MTAVVKGSLGAYMSHCFCALEQGVEVCFRMPCVPEASLASKRSTSHLMQPSKRQDVRLCSAPAAGVVQSISNTKSAPGWEIAMSKASTSCDQKHGTDGFHKLERRFPMGSCFGCREGQVRSEGCMSWKYSTYLHEEMYTNRARYSPRTLFNRL
jgi:hypothetical protein